MSYDMNERERMFLDQISTLREGNESSRRINEVLRLRVEALEKKVEAVLRAIPEPRCTKGLAWSATDWAEGWNACIKEIKEELRGKGMEL